MVDLDRIKNLSRFMDEKGLIELEFEEEGFKVKIKKGPQLVSGQESNLEGEFLVRPEEESKEPVTPVELSAFTSPMVGIFFRRPEEGAKPYVQIGDRVKPGDILCHIRAMGIKNEIKSDIEGTIAEVLVEDGHSVDYGQKLFLIKPK